MPTDFLLTVIASSTGTTALLGFAAFLLRTQISQWLSKDLEHLKAQFARDLETEKGKQQRELESYKVGLITLAEQAKNAAAIKQASALLILEKKFQAISNLHTAVNSVSSEVATTSMRKDKTQEQAKSAALCMNQFLDAIHAAHPFMTTSEFEAFDRCWDLMRTVVINHCEVGTPEISGESIAPPRDAIEHCKEILTAHIKDMAVI